MAPTSEPGGHKSVAATSSAESTAAASAATTLVGEHRYLGPRPRRARGRGSHSGPIPCRRGGRRPGGRQHRFRLVCGQGERLPRLGRHGSWWRRSRLAGGTLRNRTALLLGSAAPSDTRFGARRSRECACRSTRGPSRSSRTAEGGFRFPATTSGSLLLVSIDDPDTGWLSTSGLMRSVSAREDGVARVDFSLYRRSEAYGADWRSAAQWRDSQADLGPLLAKVRSASAEFSGVTGPEARAVLAGSRGSTRDEGARGAARQLARPGVGSARLRHAGGPVAGFWGGCSLRQRLDRAVARSPSGP